MEKNMKWIIGIIVVIVLAIVAIPVLALLLVIGGGYTQGTPSCLFEEAGFVCNVPVTPIIDSEGGVLYGKFQHAQNEAIIVHRIAFVEGADKNTEVKCWKDSGNIEINSRTPTLFKEFTVDTTDSGIKGCKANGDILSLTPGAQVRGKLFIEYNFKSDETLGVNKPRYTNAMVIANVE